MVIAGNEKGNVILIRKKRLHIISADDILCVGSSINRSSVYSDEVIKYKEHSNTISAKIPMMNCRGRI